MTKLYYCLFIFIGILGLQAQEVAWQKDIKSSSKDFLNSNLILSLKDNIKYNNIQYFHQKLNIFVKKQSL